MKLNVKFERNWFHKIVENWLQDFTHSYLQTNIQITKLIKKILKKYYERNDKAYFLVECYFYDEK